MRILFLTPWYPDDYNPNHGIFVRDQVLTLKRHHEVCVISSKISYDRFGFLSWQKLSNRFEGVQEFRIRIRRSFLIFNQLNYFLITVWQTWKIAKEFKPDIIHGNIGYPGAFWSWIISKVLSRPFIITEHTRITNNFRTFIHKWLTIFSIKRASAIVAVSQWQAAEIYSFVKCTPIVIPNIVDVEKFRNVRPAPIFPPFQIGFLGGLDTEVKGLDILLKAMGSVKTDFTLHIGGRGKLLDEYKQMAKELGIAEKCIFYGFVRHDEVSGFMKRLHFFVSASRFETFGIVMVEAMACGLPVIATDSGGSREFMQRENGILIPSENLEALKEAVLKLMESFEKYNPDQIKSTVTGKYSSDAFLDKISKVYAGVSSKFVYTN